MAYLYPYGDTQQLNLDWLIEQWNEVKSQIDGSLQAEIDRVEAAITDLLTARDEAVAAQTAAQASAQAAAGSANTASGAASTATAQAQAAAGSAATAGAHASNAQQYMLTADQYAQAAQNSAGAAANSANTANGAKQDAQMYAQQAAGSAQNAQGSAVAAQQQFNLADAARQAAQGYASDAADSAQEAQDILDSIPEDYSSLAADVTALQADVTEFHNPFLDVLKTYADGSVTSVLRRWTVSGNRFTVAKSGGGTSDTFTAINIFGSVLRARTGTFGNFTTYEEDFVDVNTLINPTRGDSASTKSIVPERVILNLKYITKPTATANIGFVYLVCKKADGTLARVTSVPLSSFTVAGEREFDLTSVCANYSQIAVYLNSYDNSASKMYSVEARVYTSPVHLLTSLDNTGVETALKNYSVNDIILTGNRYFRVTAPIATGEQFSTSTNVVVTSLGEEITRLLNAVNL